LSHDLALSSASSIPLLAHLVVATALILRILYRKLEVNTALAWIVLLIGMPIAGVVLYILFGEHSLGQRRLKLGRRIRSFYQDAYAIAGVDGAALDAVPEPFASLATSMAADSGFPALARNGYAILTDAGEILERMARDIDAAQASCSLEFYIIEPRGRVEAVLEAILRAAARGVSCRILADDYGSKSFFKSPWPKRLKAAGVSVVRSLPVGLFKPISKRSDLRNHRKLLICDRAVAYTGSFNLVDPALFKADRNVGAWIDVMMRIEGDMVDALSCVFHADFLFEENRSDFDGPALTGLPLDARKGAVPRGRLLMQLLPSGPEMKVSTIYELIVAAIFGARRRVRIVTPYFIPDEAVLLALVSAAKRGVKVQLIVPRRLDTRIGQYASQSSYAELLAAGVEIRRFTGGLLHTKALLIDEQITVFGTVNMDLRSFYLNLELSLIMYEAQINSAFDAVMDAYVVGSEALDPEAWAARGARQRFLENLMRLAAPVL
jgi:cardiolipin synthase